MQVKSTVATHHSRQGKSKPIQLTKKEKNYPTAFRRKFYARFTHVSHEHTSHLSLQTKKVHAHPPLKKRVVYATDHPLQDLRKRYKGELTPLWSLLTETNKKSIPTHSIMTSINWSRCVKTKIKTSCPTMTFADPHQTEESYSLATRHHTRTKRFQTFLSSNHLSPIALKTTFIHKQ